jgi:uncharacterized protein (TIGR04255 family)
VFELPGHPRYHLNRAPLVQALGQVRFPLISRLGNLDGIRPLQDRLEASFPFLERQDLAGVSIQIGPEAPPPEVETTTMWQLSNEEGTLLSVGPGIATLSASRAYEGVEWFAGFFRQLLDALEEAYEIRRCDRLGVRYLNTVEAVPGEPRAWRQMFRPELTGWMAVDILKEGTRIENSISQMSLIAQPVDEFADAPGEVRGVVRSGLVQAGTLLPGIPPVIVENESFLFDMDFFQQVQQSFRSDDLVSQFLAMHAQIDGFFRWSLTDEGASFFGLEVVE